MIAFFDFNAKPNIQDTMRTIVLAGHLSKFGYAFLEEVLQNEFFDVQTVVLADAETWISFHRKLKRVQKIRNEKGFKRKFAIETRKAKQLITARRPGCHVVIINDINTRKGLDLCLKSDVILCAAFPQILEEKIIYSTPAGAINFHPSYLPRCRGAHPIYWTIASGEQFGGVSSHFMARALDAGPLIARKKLDFNPQEITYADLYQKAIDILPDIIQETALFLQSGQKPAPQPEEDVTYFTNDLDIHHKIFWQNESGDAVSAKIRAGDAFCYTAANQRLYLLPPVELRQRISRVTNHYDQNIAFGAVAFFENDRIGIKCREGYLIANFVFKGRISSRLQRLAGKGRSAVGRWIYSRLLGLDIGAQLF